MLEDRYKAVAFRTRDEIARRYPDRDLARGGYQDAGDRLDIETEGAWVVQGLERRDPADDALVVVDCPHRQANRGGQRREGVISRALSSRFFKLPTSMVELRR